MKLVQLIIQELGKQYGFLSVVLTDSTGLPLATSSNGENGDALAAFVTEMLRVSSQAGNRLMLGKLGELIMIYDQSDRRVICRRFVAGGHELILGVLISSQKSYRRATNQTIREIQRVWKL